MYSVADIIMRDSERVRDSKSRASPVPSTGNEVVSLYRVCVLWRVVHFVKRLSIVCSN